MSKKASQIINIKDISNVPYTDAVRGVVTKAGNGAHIMVAKTFIGMDVLILVLNPGMLPQINKHKIVTKDGEQFYEATVHPGFSEVKMFLRKKDVDKNKVLYSLQ